MTTRSDTWHNLPPLLAQWRWKQNGAGQARLIAPDGAYETKDYTYNSKAIAEALRYVHSKPKALAVAESPIVGVAMMDASEAREYLEMMRTDLARIDGALGNFRARALDFKEREGWRALGYAGYLEAINAELGTQYSKSYLSRLLKAAEIERLLELPMGNSETIPERTLRPLASLDTPEQQKAAWQQATAAAGGTPKVQHVEQAVRAHKPSPAPWICDACGQEQTGMRRPEPPICTGCAMQRIDLAVGQRSDPHKPDPKEPPAPSLDRILPSDFAEAQQRAKKLGFWIDAKASGVFGLHYLDTNDAAGGAIDWPSLLALLARKELAKDLVGTRSPAKLPAQIDWNEIARLCYSLGAERDQRAGWETWQKIGHALVLHDARTFVKNLLSMLGSILADEGPAAQRWVETGWVLLNQNEDSSVPTLASEGISSPLDDVAAALATIEAWAQRYPGADAEELHTNLHELHELEQSLEDLADADGVDTDAWERLAKTRGELETLLRERLDHQKAVSV